MKKYLALIALSALALVSCEKNPSEELSNLVKIEPIITRATMVNFEAGDRIGLTVTKAGGVHAENACLTYDATSAVFSGDLKWYADGGEACSLTAFYPYSEDGIPSSFTVGADQSEGAGAYDFMMAAKENVYPQAAGVAMVFQHQLSQIKVQITNECGASIENVVIKNTKPTANITVSEGQVSVAVDETSSVADILAEEVTAGTLYRAIVVPQTCIIGVTVNVAAGGTITQNCSEVTLLPGYSYNVLAEVLSDQVKVSVSGEIANWEDGGLLSEYVVPFEEFDTYFEYAGLRYDKVTLTNGQVWMKEPLAYAPVGTAVSEDPANGQILYPYTSDGTTVTVKKDAATIKTNGYLYRYDAIFGKKITADNHGSFEGARGICPTGWHIPTRDEWFALCGNSNKSVYLGETTSKTDAAALFYDATFSAGTVPNFNAGGFNFTMSGCVANNAYNALITNDSLCSVAELLGKNRMTYVACSSPSSTDGTKMFALMTTFTSANNTGKVSLADITLAKGAAQVRCIKDAPETE